MIHLQCPACTKALKLKDELAGKKLKCPSCGKPVAVPQSTATLASRGKPSSANLEDEGTLPPKDAVEEGTLLPKNRGQAGKESVSDVEGKTAHGAGRKAEVTQTRATAGAKPELYDFLAPAEKPDEIGRLGSYRVLKVLGAGGMGVVYKAEDPGLQRLVALKAMLPALAASESARKRFLREARAAAAINHDNIVHIYQVSEDRGIPFMAMQFLEGEPLDERVKRDKKMPLLEILRIGRETAEGLAAAHQRGLIHRDIKPANLWLEGDKGRIKILDFGLARTLSDQTQLTQTGAIIGTPAYMAPEQAGGKTVDHRCDLFSLGCVLYRMAAGNTPFKGVDTISILSAIALETPTPPAQVDPEVPQELSDLIMTLLAKKAEDRPLSANEVVKALKNIEGQTAELTARQGHKTRKANSSTIRAEAARTQPGRSAKKWLPLPWLVGMVGGLLAAVIAGIVLFWPTPHGLVKIESDDPSVEIVFDKTGPTIKGADNEPISLRAGEHGILVRSGDFTFETDKFVLKKGETITLKVELLPGKIQLVQDGKVLGSCHIPLPKTPAADAAKKDTIATELEKLQGHWLLVAFEVNGEKMSDEKVKMKGTRLTTTGHNYRTVGRSVDGTEFITEATIKLDPTKKPKAFDGTITFVTRGNEKGQTRLGIYELEGDQLTVCLTVGKERPQDFTTRPGNGHSLWIWRRVKPAQPSTGDGFVPLFNGKDLTGWKTHPDNPGDWRVENGILIGRGPTRSLLFTGNDTYTDFHLRVEARINSGGSSGLCFRIPLFDHSKSRVQGRGYRALINNTPGKKVLTGSLKHFPGATVTDMLIPPNEWFTLEVLAEGHHILIRINGKKTVDLIDSKQSYRRGYVALQVFQPATVVQFRKIEIKELPQTKTENALSPTFKNNLGMEFVLVPKGKSWLGGGGGKLGNKEVEIAHDFYLGKYEVTQEEWQKVMGNNPSYFSRTGGGKDQVTDITDAELNRFPVEQVSWTDAQIFVKELNQRVKENGWLYHLPTQAEWEYACRGGPPSNPADRFSNFYFENPTNLLLPDQANFKHEKSLNRTCKVGSYPPNRLGLHDMHGNVAELCDDAEKPADGASLWVWRGGGWPSLAAHCRAVHRFATIPSRRANGVGLRLARVPVGKQGK